VTVLADIPHETVKEIWPRAMFGVMPSLVPETFGGVFTEAMQGGRPMIATAIGGALDTIQPGETGLLVPPGDVTALADAMRTLIADGPLRERMGALAATRAVERYSADVVVPRFEALYAGMIARARGCREVGREAGIRA
jgi:glycosyltransferase involved in cell wall biosynthesis